MGGLRVENTGSVRVAVQPPGPDTHSRTPAAGNHVKNVVLRRGRMIAGAEGG